MAQSWRELPKAELHVHLEGAVEPETLLEIDPSLSVDEVRRRYCYADFAGFLKSYGWVTAYLRGPSEYALAARRLFERLRTQNVVYAEVNLSAGVMLWRNQDFHANYDAVRKEARTCGIRLRFILDGVRQWGADHVRRVAELAVERAGDGVIGFGIGGDEAAGPAELFADSFALARRHGLRLAPHAGETTGPESIWGALRFGAERIGHGIRAVGDPALMRHLRDHDIPLEICISSNVATGAVAKLEDHPVRRLFDAGVPITLSTDDPAMFHTTLEREYEIAASAFGFTDAELERIVQNSFCYAFEAQ